MNPGCSEDISLGELVTLIEELTGKKHNASMEELCFII